MGDFKVNKILFLRARGLGIAGVARALLPPASSLAHVWFLVAEGLRFAPWMNTTVAKYPQTDGYSFSQAGGTRTRGCREDSKDKPHREGPVVADVG